MGERKSWSIDESALIQTERCLRSWLGEGGCIQMEALSAEKEWSIPFYSNHEPAAPLPNRGGRLHVHLTDSRCSPLLQLDSSTTGAIRVVPSRAGKGFLLQVDGITRGLLANSQTNLRSVDANMESVTLFGCEALGGIDRFQRCKSLRIHGENAPGELDLMAAMKSLSFVQLATMKDLTNIDFLANIKSLVELSIVDCSYLGNLTALSSLPNLRRLDVVGCGDCTYFHAAHTPKLDLSQISAAKSLKELRLTQIEVREETARLDLPALEHLHLELDSLHPGPQISGIESLGNLRSLNTLWAETFGGVDSLSTLTCLQRLRVYCHAELESLDWLSGMRDLRELSICFHAADRRSLDLPLLGRLESLILPGGSSDPSVASVLRLPGLQKLSGLGWEADDYRDLSALRQLRSLEFCLSQARSMDGLEQLTELEELDISVPPGWQKLGWLSRLTKMRRLRLSQAHFFDGLEDDVPVIDLASIANLANLSDLQIELPIESLTNTPRTPSLTSLTLESCYRLRSLDGIENLKNLISLKLRHTRNSLDLTILTTLSSLESVEVRPEKVKVMDMERFDGARCIPPHGLAPGFEALADSPTLRFAELSLCDHRSAELEATLAARRKDASFVRYRFDHWMKLLETAHAPERTVRPFLRALVQLADCPEDWERVNTFVELISQWGSAWEFTQKTLAEHGVPLP